MSSLNIDCFLRAKAATAFSAS